MRGRTVMRNPCRDARGLVQAPDAEVWWAGWWSGGWCLGGWLLSPGCVNTLPKARGGASSDVGWEASPPLWEPCHVYAPGREP